MFCFWCRRARMITADKDVDRVPSIVVPAQVGGGAA